MGKHRIHSPNFTLSNIAQMLSIKVLPKKEKMLGKYIINEYDRY